MERQWGTDSWLTVAMLTDSRRAGCLLARHPYPSNQVLSRAALPSQRSGSLLVIHVIYFDIYIILN